MDWYSYYMERFGWGHNPNESVAMCQREVMEMVNNHIIPFRVSTEAAVGFLCALTDFAGDCCSVSFPFRIVMSATIDALQRAYGTVENLDRAWAREVMEANGAPPYEPPEFECWEVDLAEADYDGIDDDPALAISQMYGDDGEPGTTGTRRPFPDWEHIRDWSATDWLKLQRYKDKVIAGAEAGFIGVSAVAGVLAAAKGAMCCIPLERQVELGLWAQDVVDTLMVGLEDDLQKMLAGSVHSHEGRLVQKQLLSVTNE